MSIQCQLKCTIQNHDTESILGCCFYEQCDQTWYCKKCLNEKHSHHTDHCQPFESIKQFNSELPQIFVCSIQRITQIQIFIENLGYQLINTFSQKLIQNKTSNYRLDEDITKLIEYLKELQQLLKAFRESDHDQKIQSAQSQQNLIRTFSIQYQQIQVKQRMPTVPEKNINALSLNKTEGNFSIYSGGQQNEAISHRLQSKQTFKSDSTTQYNPTIYSWVNNQSNLDVIVENGGSIQNQLQNQDFKGATLKLYKNNIFIGHNYNNFNEAMPLQKGKDKNFQQKNYNMSFHRAQELKDQNRCQEALKYYDEALNLNDYQIYQGKALALSSLDRYEEALLYFDSALNLKSDDYEIHFGKARALTILNRCQEAQQYYDQALNLEQNNSQIIFWKDMNEKLMIFYNINNIYSKSF